MTRHYTPRSVRPIADRFWDKVEIPIQASGCWSWSGTSNPNGYGYLGRGRAGTGSVAAHRIAYELHTGPIAPGMEVDHLCRNPGCVNPNHLEVVTHKENMHRGSHRNTKKTECHRGHSLSGDNLHIDHRGSRQCLTCRRELDKQRMRRIRAAKKENQ
jgi:hypothetical protein